MTRTLVRSLIVIAAALAACNPGEQTVTTPGGEIPGGPVSVGGVCPSDGSFGAMSGGSATGAAGASTGRPGFGSPFTPQVGTTRSAAEAPPAISGGTLAVLPDGQTVIAADPDRDRVYVVDLVKRQVKSTIMLEKGDEPGRVVVDAAGHAHVALRRGGALVSIDPATGAILNRRTVCAAPRGIGYDSVTDLLHVACADGQLVSFNATGGDAVRRRQLDADLRDVIVDGGRLRVSRFKSAEVLTVEGDGAMSKRTVLPIFRSLSTRNWQRFAPAVAWRTVQMPSGGVAVLHQRGVDDAVQAVPGGYAGFNQCDSIVQTAVTIVGPNGETQSGPAMAGMPVSVDMAVSNDGSKIAIVSAGNATNSESDSAPARLPRLFVTTMDNATDPVTGCASDGAHGPCLPAGGFLPTDPSFGTGAGGTTGAGGATDSAGAPLPTEMTGSGGGTADPANPVAPPDLPTTCPNDGSAMTGVAVPQVVGEPIAVAFAANNVVIVQSREPAVLSVPGGGPISLSTESRADTGHALFHANAGGSIACASCHAEGNEDGRTWNFQCEGPRRTQSLQVGLKGTEPFHWGGDEKDFSQLVRDVFVGRMSGPDLRVDQIDATLHWIDAQPRLPRTLTGDPAAAARGRTIFNDPKGAACATCHTGSNLTNNQTVDVGTGGKFQVPSLVGIGSRGPFLHNGCAETLQDRFTPAATPGGVACGGGDKHGVTSKLKPAELADLITYLNTL